MQDKVKWVIFGDKLCVGLVDEFYEKLCKFVVCEKYVGDMFREF